MNRAHAVVVALAVLILVLLIRPQGILGSRKEMLAGAR